MKKTQLRNELYKKISEIFLDLKSNEFQYNIVIMRKRKSPDEFKKPKVVCQIDTGLCMQYKKSVENVEEKVKEIVKAVFAKNIDVVVEFTE